MGGPSRMDTCTLNLYNSFYTKFALSGYYYVETEHVQALWNIGVLKNEAF